MKELNNFQLFGISGIRIEKELLKLTAKGVEIGRNIALEDVNEVDLDGFSPELKNRASKMAQFYQLFYCLENSVKELVIGILKESHGVGWWDKEKIVPDGVKQSAKQNKQNEENQGFTLRSEFMIDYINFGELSIIIDKNWDNFSDVLKNKMAVKRILTQLNRLRSPIAHCNELADDEVGRLVLALKDWNRQMT